MIEIRACAGLDEMEACVQLELDIWGYDAGDIVPRKSFLLSQKIGGQVIGAFDSEMGEVRQANGLVGFVYSLPAFKNTSRGPAPYLHSHMLAVRESHRNRGVGAQLKLEQRREALARGIRHIEWTFDPLEMKNAFLNIHKLGAIARSYRVNFYGVSSSRLQGGLPTDRLLAEWDLDSPRVEAILSQRPADHHRIQEQILVPSAVGQWKASEATRAKALAVQQENQLKFQDAFRRGLVVLDVSRDTEGNGVYELGPLPVD